MSQVDRYKPYKGAAAGWGALIAVTRNWLGSENALKNIRAMLKTNQNGGFDCPGCAWGESPENGMVKFCENGAKAVNWEATGRLVNPAFFNKYSVSTLAGQSDYWLEYQGRLTHPMRYDAATDRYVETTWDQAFALIARHLNALDSPNQAEFYTSGRASNEAAFLYQLFVRAYGTNNFPDCSNMCHEASAVSMIESLGVGKGTVVFDDLEHADAIFVIGQNPGTNHPRMLEPLREAVKRGAQVICINPLKERGLERFQHPQHPIEMLLNGSEPTNTAYFRPALGGDMAVMRGMAKFLLQWEREAQASGGEPVFDHAFIAEHTSGLDAYLDEVDGTSWEHIEQQSGMTLADIELAARMYARAKRVIMCWAMGLTQHTHSVPTLQEVINLMLLRGNVGRPGAGLSPVRGHSNVQGDRTMGINELAPTELLDALEKALFVQAAARAWAQHCDGDRRDGAGTFESVYRPRWQLRPGHPRHPAHPCRVAQVRPDRAHRHQAQSQPSGDRAPGADPAVPGPHRYRRASRGAPGRHRGRHLQHDPHLPWTAQTQVQAPAVGACDHCRDRRRDPGQASDRLELGHRRLRAHSQHDRRHHSRLRGISACCIRAASICRTMPRSASGKPRVARRSSLPVYCRSI